MRVCIYLCLSLQKVLAGVDDLQQVKALEMRVDTREKSLGNFGKKTLYLLLTISNFSLSWLEAGLGTQKPTASVKYCPAQELLKHNLPGTSHSLISVFFCKALNRPENYGNGMSDTTSV